MVSHPRTLNQRFNRLFVLLLKNCKSVITLEKERPVLKNMDILIEDGIITEMGRKDKSGEVIDCSNLLIMPALVNSFVKLESPVEDLPPELALKMIKIFLIDSLVSGVTTLLTSLTRFKEKVKSESEKMGLRLMPVTLINFSDILSNSLDFLDESRLKIIDLALTRREVFKVKNTTGNFPVELLYNKGLLNENTVLVCPAWITSREISLVIERGAKIVICASISAYSGLGSFTPVRDMMYEGATIGLGTYDPRVNMNMFEETRFSLMCYRHNYYDMSLGEIDFLRLASHGGFKILGINAGTVREGRSADLIGVSLEKALLDYRYIVNNFRETISLAIANGEIILKSIDDIILEKKRLMKEINEKIYLINSS